MATDLQELITGRPGTFYRKGIQSLLDSRARRVDYLEDEWNSVSDLVTLATNTATFPGDDTLVLRTVDTFLLPGGDVLRVANYQGVAGIFPKPPPTAWVDTYWHTGVRYLDVNGDVITTSGTAAMIHPNGRPAFTEVRFPAGIIHRLEILTSSPGDIDDGVGAWTTLTDVAASVRRLLPDVKVYEVGGAFTWHVISRYEWRGIVRVNDDGASISGWEDHSLDGVGEVIIHDPRPSS